MNRIIITSTIALSLFLGTVAFAQDYGTVMPNPSAAGMAKPKLGEMRTDLKVDRTDVKNTIQENRAQIRTIIGENRADVRDMIQENRKEFLDTAKEKRESLQIELKAKREALQAEVQKIKKESVVKRRGYVEQKLRQVVTVIGQHQARVQTAIDAFDTKGLDTGQSKTHLAESKTDLKKAVEQLALLSEVVVSDTDSTTVATARGYAKAAEEALKSSRTHLIESVRSLKELNGEKDDSKEIEETSTEQTTTTTNN